MTTENQIEQANDLKREFEKIPGTTHAHVDDWDNDGGFNIFVYVRRPEGIDAAAPTRTAKRLKRYAIMHRVQALIRAAGAHYEWHDGPRMQYETIDGVKYRKGYDRNDYKISVRFDDRTPEPPKPEPKFACRADMPDGER